MKKIVIHSAGGYEKMKVENHPDPVPGDGEVLVAVKSAGVNFADIAVRWGLYESAKKFVGWPITPGFEFSGVVSIIGKDVKEFKPGDKVFGVTLFGAYSSLISADENKLFKIPSSFSFDEAAGFIAVFLTAYHALFQQFLLRKGMNILVHSAAGGVGTSLLQLGKIAGCNMTGVVGSSHKIDVAEKFGAAHVIDKSKRNLWKEAEKISPLGYDVILDANGASTLKESFNHVREGGKLVCYGFHSMFPKSGGKVNYPKLVYDYLRTPRFNPLDMTNQNKSLITFNLSFLFYRNDLLNEAMDSLLKWIAEGKIIPPKVTPYPLEAVGEAHKALESGQTTGKLVLTML